MRTWVDPSKPIQIEGLWIAECRDCGEFRVGWEQGWGNHWFRINDMRHSCHGSQYWDHAPATWFCSAVMLGTLNNGTASARKWP